MNKEIQETIFKRLSVTFGILLFFRLGTLIPVPGINHSDLALYIQSHSVTRFLISAFSGDNTFVIGLFTLSIFPYINASILVQILISYSTELSNLLKEGDLEGKRSINRLTRFISFIWAIIQSVSITFYLKQILFDWNFSLAVEIVLWLTTGAMIILWLSEFISDYGLGSGASLFIYINIISVLPHLIKAIYFENQTNVTFFSKIVISLLLFAALYGIVFLQEGLRMIPLISSKQLNQSSFENFLITDDNYLPIRFNQAGVMPIILTTVILVLPNYGSIIGLLPKINFSINLESFSIFYWLGYFLLILLFSLYYSAIVLNPKDLSDQLQKMSVAIPGIRPGVQTAFYLKEIMTRSTLLGGIVLATVATVPNFIESTLNITNLYGLSNTSLLILAGVILDFVRELKNVYFSNVYTNMYESK